MPSPLEKIAFQLHPIEPGADYPDAWADDLAIMRRALAEFPPETPADAAEMAEELAAMVAGGTSCDGADIKMARALAEGLRRIAKN